MVKIVTIDDVVHDPVTGRNSIKGPGKITGAAMTELVKSAALSDKIQLKLPFEATNFKCTQNLKLADKCLGIAPAVKKAKKKTTKKTAEVQTKKVIDDIVSKYVNKV